MHSYAKITLMKIAAVWLDLHVQFVSLNGLNVCQYYGSIKNDSHFKVHTYERTRVHNFLSSLDVHPIKY
jgi:hypothetical protein